MKLSLPSKLTLGGSKQKNSEPKKEESEPEGPKYSAAEVKLMVIAVEVSVLFR